MTVLGLGLALVVGLSLGLLGGGGSVLTVPIFVYVMGFEAKQAIAMSLIVVGVASLVGAVRHWHAGRVNLRVAVSFGLVAMAASYAGARLAKFVSGPTQLILLAIVVCAAAISMARSARADPIGPAAGEPASPAGSPPALGLMPVAIGVGLLTGLVGVGGGFLIVPALVLLGRVPIKLAIGTSLLVIAMNCAAGIVGYLGHVTIPWEVVGLFTAVAIAGLFAGTHLCGFVSPVSLRRGFAVLLMCVGTFVLVQNWHVLASAASSGYGRASSWHPRKGVMLVRRLYHPRLAQASYLIACNKCREAVVIDPLRDAELYLAAAAAENVRITAVTETHVHADFISGSRELAARTGARLYLSGEGRGSWSYTDAYIADAGATLLHAGDVIRIGDVEITALHTPGHTPEHLSFLVTDSTVAAEPMAAVTGDFVFVGDVGRPDLLERAVLIAGSADSAARQLHASVRRFASFADHLQIWPGHGAGSACGKDLSGVPQSALGYERRYNWAFRVEDEDEFVETALHGLAEPPAYFAEMKRVNARGPGHWSDVKRPALVSPADIVDAVERGAMVIDTRPAADFGAGHIPGTINIPLNRSFLLWAGSLIPLASAVTLIGDEAQLADAVRDLALIGIDHVAGYAGPEVVEAWRQSGRPLEQVAHTTTDAVAAHAGKDGVTVIDVRYSAEWDAGHVPGAIHIPLGMLRGRLAELPRDRPLVVHCQTGGRAAIATSVLQAAGFGNVVEMHGGMTAWRRAGHDIVTGQDG